MNWWVLSTLPKVDVRPTSPQSAWFSPAPREAPNQMFVEDPGMVSAHEPPRFSMTPVGLTKQQP